MAYFLKLICLFPAMRPEISSNAVPSHSARMSFIFAVTRNVARSTGSSRSTWTWPSWVAKSLMLGYPNSHGKYQSWLCIRQIKLVLLQINSPICVGFKHVSTRSLLPGIEASRWQPDLETLSNASFSCFSVPSWSSWNAQHKQQTEKTFIRTQMILWGQSCRRCAPKTPLNILLPKYLITSFGIFICDNWFCWGGLLDSWTSWTSKSRHKPF